MDYRIHTDGPRCYIRTFRKMIETNLQREGFIGLVGGTREPKADVLGKVQAYKLLLQDAARIVLCAQNSVEWVCIFCACVLEEKELFILDAHIDRKKLHDLAASVQADLVITDEEADPGEPGFCSIRELPFRTWTAETAVGTGKVILYTTGTTGSPKGVEVMLPGIVTNLVDFQKLLRLERCENALLTTAFSHAMGLISLLTALCYGGSIFITQNEMQILYGIMHEDAQFMTIPPVFMNMLKSRSDYVEKLKAYRVIITGGAGMNKETYLYYQEQNINLINGYGMTEAMTVVALTVPSQKPWEMTLLDWCEARLSDEGELLIKGPCVCCRYYGGEAIADEDMWYHTGDVARLNGRTLEILHRLDSVYVMKTGFKVNLDDLERRIIGIEEVAECRSFVRRSGNAENLCVEVVLQPGYQDRAQAAVKIRNAAQYFEHIADIVFTEQVTMKGGKKSHYESD